MPATSKGRFVWHELLTTDIPAAQKFYPAITGWTIQEWDGEGGQKYPMWVAGETPIGGTMELPEMAKKNGAPPNWLAYISTPAVDKTAEEATRLGGKVVHGPFDIPTIGRMVILADPQGAVFAAYTASGEEMAREGEPAVGEFSWHELATTDYKAAFDFYQKLFGWKQFSADEVMPGMVYLMYGLGNDMYGGIYTRPKEEMGAPPAWQLYVRVRNADEAARKTEELGGKVIAGPMDVPGGDRVAMGFDPQGAFFGVHSKAQG